ncbi:MAG: DEAD/DEAH box helicase [Bacteroidota bacterium]
MANKFIQVIDLTSSPAKKQREAQEQHQEPENALPEATFDGLPDALQRAVHAAGWSSLMPVQSKAIPYALDRRDLIVQSRTGSGKTGAFLLPLFELLDPSKRAAQALILAPTRELARQTYQQFEAMNEGLDAEQQLSSVLVYGGTRYNDQIDAFKRGTHVVIGTPGRILDHLQRGTLDLEALKVLILDEADEMLSMGFYPDMLELKRYLSPGERYSYMYSATMPYKVQVLGEVFLNDPEILRIGHVSVDTMEHRYMVLSPMDKNSTLVRLIELQNPDSAIIFANTRRQVDFVARMLHNYGFDVQGLSGDLKQRDRERIVKRLKAGELRFLVATDVAARGIDISDLGHIFQYDVPQDPEYYVHRAGRTARAGKSGVNYTLVTMAEVNSLLRIGSRYDIDLERVEPPTQEAVEERVSERVTALLETRTRQATDVMRERVKKLTPYVEQLIDNERIKLLALLVDEFYHASLHGTTNQEATADSAEVPEFEVVREKLEAHFKSKSLLNQDRIDRFIPMIRNLIAEEEPQPLARVLDDFLTSDLDARGPEALAEKEDRSYRKRGNGGGGNRGGGRGRRRKR